ncbi:MAG: 2-oxoacid:acceptor oxidoreductase subunit alpha [Firmicutes bacterium]|nr:2-oxoacid:acceptor oxidoreductase subunit alpha [Bacillota bacterium]
MVGGQQGEGIESTGEIFVQAMNRLGYWCYAYRHFASRVKGGHTNFKIRISGQEVRRGGDEIHCLVAFDQESIDHNWPDIKPGAVVAYDSATFEAKVPGDKQVTLVPVPMSKIAKDLGAAIMKNMVAVGVSAALLGLSPEDFASTMAGRFGKKGGKVVQSNAQAVQQGYDGSRSQFGTLLQLPERPKVTGEHHMLITGNEAVGLGALAAGCRLYGGYPITPATPVMYYLVSNLPRVGGAVVQTEDEIAAINVVVGGNYAGTRTMTATSGPGLSLMQEALSLSGMTETPAVVVDVQRAGPSTGLPTKLEQSDINMLVYGSHGEFPRVVLAPASVSDCFYLTMEAFNLAEELQCPVFVAIDLALGLSKQSIDPVDRHRVPIRRGKRVSEYELAAMDGKEFARYTVTDDGISPRSVPGQHGGRYVATGDEHTVTAHITEDPPTRTTQMMKRLRKLKAAHIAEPLRAGGANDPELLIIGFGSPTGAVSEAAAALSERGHRVAEVQLQLIWPFPRAELMPLLQKSERVLVVEHNATGQLANIIRLQCDYWPLSSLLKFDGNPFAVHEIVARAEALLAMPPLAVPPLIVPPLAAGGPGELTIAGFSSHEEVH